MSISRIVRSAAVVAVTAVAATLCTGTVSASAVTDSVGTIVFLKDHNVWIARGDGTGAHAVTTNGTAANEYLSPSESDTGIVVAAQNSFIIRMRQDGRLLNKIDPPALKNSAGESMDGTPAQVAVSPDGKTIAWTFSWYSCPPAADCGVRSATGYTRSTSLSLVGPTVFERDPSWITNTRTLSTAGFGSQITLHDVSGASQNWFNDSDYANPSTDLSDGEVSPNAKWLSEVRGYGSGTHIIWYQIRGNVRTGTAPAYPKWKCYTNLAAGFTSPTWSPDSARLAWAEPDGIWIEPNAAGCRDISLMIPGGSAPDWAKAVLQ